MFNTLKSVPKWALILISIFLMFLSGYLMYYYTNHQTSLNMVLVVFSVLLFVLFMNYTVSRIAQFKPKKINYPMDFYKHQSFNQLEKNLLDFGFEETKAPFGAGFTKVIDKTLFKVLLINNVEAYQNMDENGYKQKPTKGAKQCSEFVGFEIFYSYNEKLLENVANYSFTGENVLYEGFIVDKDESVIVEANKIDNKHQDSYNKLINILKLEEDSKPVKYYNKKELKEYKKNQDK